MQFVRVIKNYKKPDSIGAFIYIAKLAQEMEPWEFQQPYARQLNRKGSAHFSSSGISNFNEIRLRGKIRINIDRNAVVLI